MTMNSTDQSMTQFVMPDGTVVNVVDWKDMPRWSTADLLTGFTDERIDLFTYNVSDEVSSSSNITARRQATGLDTNVALNNAMASSEEMFIYSIIAEYVALATDPETPTDAQTATERAPMQPIPQANQLAALQRHMRFEIEISQKIAFECRLAALNTGYGVAAMLGQQAVQAVANLSTVTGNAGSPSADAVRRLAIPIHWGGQEKGTARLTNPASGAVNFGISTLIDPDETSRTNTLYRVIIAFGGLYKQPTA